MGLAGYDDFAWIGGNIAVFGSKLVLFRRDSELTGALLDRFAHHVHILEMNGESYRLRRSSRTAATSS